MRTEQELRDVMCDCPVCVMERAIRGTSEPTPAERLQAVGELVMMKCREAGVGVSDLLDMLPKPTQERATGQPFPYVQPNEAERMRNMKEQYTAAPTTAPTNFFSKWPSTFEVLFSESMKQWAKLTPEQQDAAIKKVLEL